MKEETMVIDLAEIIRVHEAHLSEVHDELVIAVKNKDWKAAQILALEAAKLKDDLEMHLQEAWEMCEDHPV